MIEYESTTDEGRLAYWCFSSNTPTQKHMKRKSKVVTSARCALPGKFAQLSAGEGRKALMAT